jgi:hypothetical protein
VADRLARSSTALLTTPSKKPFSSASLPIFALHVDSRLRRSIAAARIESIGAPPLSCAFHDVI